MISDFNNVFLKYIIFPIHSFCNFKFLFFPKQAFHIWTKDINTNHRAIPNLSERIFTQIDFNKFFPSFFCKQSERIRKQFDFHKINTD